MHTKTGTQRIKKTMLIKDLKSYFAVKVKIARSILPIYSFYLKSDMLE